MRIVDAKVLYDAGKADRSQAFACSPSLTRLADGSLLCAFKTGPAKLCASDNVTIYKSVDDGGTWQHVFSGFDTRFENTSGSIHSCYIAETAPGALLAACCWVDRSDPNAPYSNPATGGLRPIKCLAVESSDSGATWSRFREVRFGFHKAAVVSGRAIRLRNGDLLLPYENYKQWDEADGNYTSACVLSHDNGLSWSWPVIFATDPFAHHYFWDAKFAVNPRTGELLAALWTVTPAYANESIHLVRGSADGLEWSRPSPIGIVGKSAAPLFLDDSDLLLVYVDPAADGAIRAVLSSDTGAAWHTDGAVAIYNAPARAATQKDIYSAAFGGPDLVLCEGGALVVYYAGNETQLSIVSAKLKI